MATRKNYSKDRNYPALREFKAVGLDPAEVAKYGAHSIGIAPKRVAGKRSGPLALVFYVSSKRPEAKLSEEERIPTTLRHVSRKDGRNRRIPTDIVETPPASFEPDPETRIRPVPGGVSGGINGSTGTIGGWVWDQTDDSIVMLSNEHVFGTTAGTDILQQGTADGGSLPADKIGDVKRGIARTLTGTNTVDASIGDPDSADIYDLSVLEIGPAVYAIDTPVLDLLVEKFGQTTEHTFGQIIDADYSTTLTSGYFFDDCIRLEPVSPSTDWSAGGDSGSLVFSQTPISTDSTIKPAVGLHFAGGGIYGVACKIQNVFSALDLTTLCSGAFAAFLDGLSESEREERETEADRSIGFSRIARYAPLPFTRRERNWARAAFRQRGFARDVQTRLRTTRRGKPLTDFVDRNRGELLTMLAKDGDVRRATVAALKPFVGGAVTTSELFDRRFTDLDAQRVKSLVRAVQRKASPELMKALKPLLATLGRAEGRSLGQIFGVKD
jgi:hypothetical protein